MSNNRTALLKQSSRLYMDLKKDVKELDDLGELDITTILGSDFDDDALSEADQEVIKDALVKGYDLRQYSKEVEDDLNQLDKLTINDYYLERENFLILYNQIQVVDGVLVDLEVMLNNYYNELKSIGSEMNSLQEQSMGMNNKLNNRKNLKEEISKFLDAVQIQPEFASLLTKGEINQEYVQHLMQLDAKITLFDDYKKIAPGICATNEPQLSKLTVASIQKIQKFLNTNLSSFKKLAERRVKQQQLASQGFLFQFLFKYSTYIASEVINSYVESAEKFYTTYYKNYVNGLLKMQEDSLNKNDLLSGMNTNKILSFFGSKQSTGSSSPGSPSSPMASSTSSSISQSKSTSFSMGTRNDLLSNEVLESTPIEPPATESFLEVGVKLANNITTSNAPSVPTVKYPFEQLYRSMVYTLMDLVTSETIFTKDFFLGEEDITNTIFTRSMTIIMETTENYLNNSFDVVAIIMMIGMLYKYKTIMTERGIKAINQTFEKLLKLATTRFSKVFATNLESIKNTNVKDLKINSLQPHVVIRKYADFIVTLLSVVHCVPQDSQGFIIKGTAELRDHCEKLLMKMTKEIPEKDQIIFLVNNYGSILTTLHEAPNNSLNGGGDEKQFQRLFQKVLLKYIEDQLSQLKYFTQFLSFVREWGPLVESNVKIDEKSNPSFNIENVEKILLSFDQNWKSAVAVIRDNTIKHFSQCSYASDKAFELLLKELHSNYRYLILIIQKCFRNLIKSSYYRGDRVTDEMKAMNLNVILTPIEK
eukprot:gene2356-2907_t